MVTNRMLPWLGTCLALNACGGVAELKTEAGTVPGTGADAGGTGSI